jgi:hypothetical protein
MPIQNIPESFISSKKQRQLVSSIFLQDIGSLSQPGGSLFGIEHSNGGLISFPGGIPVKNADGMK